LDNRKTHQRAVTCQRCGHTWTPRMENPTVCPNQHCHSPWWNRPKKIGVSDKSVENDR